MKTYRYEMEGTAGKPGSVFKTTGTVTCDASKVYDQALLDSYRLLTEGHATFNEPGPCGGPYGLLRIVIERIDDHG